MPRPNRPRWILGLDPGTVRCGYCLLKVERPGVFRAEQMGTITPPSGPLHERLGFIHKGLGPLLMTADQIDAECVVEQPLVFGPNYATLAIAGVRGVILALIGERKLRFAEYGPRSWKQITGSGSAPKDRVAHVIKGLLGLSGLPTFDEADAAGLAIYHATRV